MKMVKYEKLRAGVATEHKIQPNSFSKASADKPFPLPLIKKKLLKELFKR